MVVKLYNYLINLLRNIEKIILLIEKIYNKKYRLFLDMYVLCNIVIA